MLEKPMYEYPAKGSEDSDGSSPKMSPLKRHGHAIPHEPLDVALVRYVLTLVWALHPMRIGMFLKSIGMLIHHYLTPAVARKLPDPERKPPGAFGLCGVVGDTSVETMMEGMRRGLYAMGHVDPMKWWSPEERCVLSFSDLKITKTLAHFPRNGSYRVTFDADPIGVLAGCAAPRKGRYRLTWITPTMMRTALDLFDAGYMHSVDMWNVDGELVGGLYGYAVGRVFVHESSFHKESHMSNIALAVLAGHLADWGFVLIDSKRMTDDYRALGYRDIPRSDLRVHLQEPAPKPAGHWRFDPSLDIDNWNPAEGPPRRKTSALDIVPDVMAG